MEELKPCPICNGQAKAKRGNFHGYIFWTVICMNCGFRLEWGSIYKDNVIKEWNRRICK